MSNRQVLHLKEGTGVSTTMKFLAGLIASASLATVGWTTLSLGLEKANAQYIELREDLNAVKSDRAETLKRWHEDQIQNAAFQSKVLEKLDRIERKMGQ